MSTDVWPGNIRELENMIEYLVITVDDPVIRPHHLPSEFISIKNTRGVETYVTRDTRSGPGLPTAPPVEILSGTTPVPPTIAEVESRSGWKDQMQASERQIYEAAVASGSSTRAIAKTLGVSQSTVVRKLKQYGLR